MAHIARQVASVTLLTLGRAVLKKRVLGGKGRGPIGDNWEVGVFEPAFCSVFRSVHGINVVEVDQVSHERVLGLSFYYMRLPSGLNCRDLELSRRIEFISSPAM